VRKGKERKGRHVVLETNKEKRREERRRREKRRIPHTYTPTTALRITIELVSVHHSTHHQPPTTTAQT